MRHTIDDSIKHVGRKNNFDFLRIIAAIAVIFSHSYPLSLRETENASEPLHMLSGGQATIGNLSVYVFFIISGFLITQSYDRSKDIYKFGLARVLRIIPALAIVVLLTAFVLGPVVSDFSPAAYFSDPQTFDYLKTALLYSFQIDLPGVFLHNSFAGSVNGALWSLKFEFLFYVVVGALGVFKLLNRKIVTALFCLTFVLQIIHFSHGERYILMFCFFAAGMLLYLFRQVIPMNKFIAIGSAAALLGSLFIGGFTELFVIFGSYIVLYFALLPSVNLSSISKYGDFSYGLYIFAFPIQQTIAQLFGGTMVPIVNFAIALPITLIFAILSWHLIEKRALLIKKRMPAIKQQINIPVEV